MAKGAYQQELATEVVYDWAERTERVVGAIMKKKKVTFSEPGRKNIRIKIVEAAKGLVHIHFYYRDSLRFSDMGAGRGYHKGVRTSAKDYFNDIKSKRKRKRILMKPIFGRLNALMDQVSTQIINVADFDYLNLMDDGTN